MDQENGRWDFWALPAYLLWLAFFLVGFDPQLAFQAARDVGLVMTQDALVNSPHLITLALAGYLGFFAFQRALEAGMDKPDAQARGLQFGILGLIAFLAFSPFQLLDYGAIPIAKYRLIVLFVGGTKLFMWFMLLGVIARYYLLGHARVFANMASIFPSSYQAPPKDAGDAAADTVPSATPPRPRTDGSQDS